MPSDAALTIVSPVGSLLLTATGSGLSGIVLLGATAHPMAGGPVPPILGQAAAELTEYFAGRRQTFDLQLDLAGLTPFTRRVLDALCRVPYGTTVTYAGLAARAGQPRAARAVGRAMAVNPLPIVIPCHRVVAAGGRPGGYSGGGGLRTKRWLLDFERARRH